MYNYFRYIGNSDISNLTFVIGKECFMIILLLLSNLICFVKWRYWRKKCKEKEYYLKIYEIKLEEEKKKKWKMRR